MSLLCGSPAIALPRESFRPRELEEQKPRLRDPSHAPLRDGRLADLAEVGDGFGAAELVDQVGWVHSRRLGLANRQVNSNSEPPRSYPAGMETLADRLRRAMSATGMNQKELAAACGVKPPSVNGWLSEKAKFLRGENLLKAARALGVSQTWLATGKGDMHDSEPLAPSQAERLDPDMICTVAEAMRIVMRRRNRDVDLTDREQAGLFADAYAELSAMRSGADPAMTAGAIVADLFAVREARSYGERTRNSLSGGLSGTKGQGGNGGKR